MDKKLIFIFMVISLFLIAGCEGSSKKETPITDFDIRKGIDGLDMEFTKSAPPPSVFEGGIFPIALNLKNKGACHIGSGTGDCTTEKKGVLVFWI